MSVLSSLSRNPISSPRV
ncbi:hypothetical protein DVH24_001968 [Malus domestica]|uniref:Uncharacterized protein n=1 Tax=Malus domestica TaxID=3750 RepID=A0A498I5G1_MALDO|nr:hypothetical protein DVH24_001968 [Malus domestica]